MKRLYIAILITICGMTAMAQDRPDMTHQTTGRDRDGFDSYEMLMLQFNEDGLIEVSGCENTNYQVTITRESIPVWYGMIGKDYGNVINYTSFAVTSTYIITLTSSRGSTVWRLENGILIGSKLPNWGGPLNHYKTDLDPLKK
ncbi:MAG: hypothetical protein IKH53_05750 [Muribaculaceae bacterium]|nr:hypothetical protein [Muribaculaceae bacterium]